MYNFLPRFDRAAGGVLVTSCQLDCDDDMALFAAEAVLSADELARAGRFRFALHRDRYIRGRGFLRRELGRLMGVPPALLMIYDEGNGKPRVAGGPDFNLSHSEGLAVLALSDQGPIGVDLEFVDRNIDVAAMSVTCFVPEERAVLARLRGPAQAERFFAFWTAKEARMKLTGEGMSLPPRSIALALEDGWPVGFRAPVAPHAGLVYHDIGVAGAMCCTVAGRARA